MRTPAATALLAAALAACGDGATAPGGAPPRFGPAEQVPAPVSTAGWEDSGFISPDGTRLYFTYLRMDPIVFLTEARIRLAGPLRPGWPTLAPYDTIGAELYRSDLVDGAWTEPVHLDATINLPEEQEGDEWVSADGQRILFTNGGAGGPRGAYGIYYAEQLNGVWQPAVLASSVGFPFVSGDENPHLTLDEQTLFFESSRPGGQGLQDLWMSTRVQGQWSAPVPLPATVNTPGVEGSPFSLDGTALYFDDKGSGRGILYSRRTAAGWTRARVVVAGAVGDPSLTLSGDLYFIGGGAVPGGFDANIFVAHPR